MSGRDNKLDVQIAKFITYIGLMVITYIGLMVIGVVFIMGIIWMFVHHPTISIIGSLTIWILAIIWYTLNRIKLVGGVSK